MREIGRHIFINCVKLKNVDLSAGLEIIGTSSFLSEIPFDSTLPPSSVKTICDSAFQFCLQLKKVELPDGLECISIRAFEGCSS